VCVFLHYIAFAAANMSAFFFHGRHIFGYLRTTLAAADRMDLLALTYADSANSVGDADIVALNSMLGQL
jgi:hypothetical protein